MILFLSSPSRHTLAVWWSPWTPTGPCPSTRQTKWRSIATGTSTNWVHTCESTSQASSKTTQHPSVLLKAQTLSLTLRFSIGFFHVKPFLLLLQRTGEDGTSQVFSKALLAWMFWARTGICLLKIQSKPLQGLSIWTQWLMRRGRDWRGGWDQRDTSSCTESQSGALAGHSAPWHAICPLATLSQHCCEAAKIKQSPALVN